MQHWAELRSALLVARLGSFSAAAAALGVHRATVNRHVETLEAAFGAPLFLRYARGATLTDAGQDVLQVATRAEEMFADLEGRSRGRAGRVSGRLIVTALAGVAPLVLPALRGFHAAYPEVALDFVAGAQLARLDHGEAHVAFRTGPKPAEPDFVVQPFRLVRFGLYAGQAYVARAGRPDPQALEGHRFVGAVGVPQRIPWAAWMEAHVAPGALALRTTDQHVLHAAVRAGLGLGFWPSTTRRRIPGW